MNFGRIVLLYKKSTLELHKDREGIKLLKLKNSNLFDSLKKAHDDHYRSVDLMIDQLKNIPIKLKVHRRGINRMPTVYPDDLIVTLGGDGTFIYGSHFIKSSTMVGVNSAPDHSVGHYCRFNLFDKDFDIIQFFDNLSKGKEKAIQLSRLEIYINSYPVGVPVINDILIADKNPATTSRYTVQTSDFEEIHKSSGIWVSTAMGSSAAYTSAGGKDFKQLSSEKKRQYGVIVREPYRGKHYKFRNRVFIEGEQFSLISGMIDGCIYIDGGQKSFPIVIGDKIEFRFHSEPLNIILPKKNK
jgi:NAD+ kinase